MRIAGVELDLLARQGGAWCAIEVKTGRLPELEGSHPPQPDLRWRPILRVDPRRLERLWRAARAWQRQHGGAVRVELVEVWRLAPSGQLSIQLSAAPEPPGIAGRRPKRL